MDTTPRRKSQKDTKVSLPNHLKENGQNWRPGKVKWQADACIHWHPQWSWIIIASNCIHCNKGNACNYKEKMIHLNKATKTALQDQATLLQVANEHPTPCTDLVQALADYRGYCNMLKSSRRSLAWFQISITSNCLVHQVFTGNPSTDGLTRQSLRYHFKFGSQNAWFDFTLAGIRKFC